MPFEVSFYLTSMQVSSLWVPMTSYTVINVESLAPPLNAIRNHQVWALENFGNTVGRSCQSLERQKRCNSCNCKLLQTVHILHFEQDWSAKFVMFVLVFDVSLLCCFLEFAKPWQNHQVFPKSYTSSIQLLASAIGWLRPQTGHTVPEAQITWITKRDPCGLLPWSFDEIYWIPWHHRIKVKVWYQLSKTNITTSAYICITNNCNCLME